MTTYTSQLCGEKEVLAQVKLAFKATTDAKMVLTRSLQLTVKKTTRSMKTLEGQLVKIVNGERTSISSRVAELDQIIPQYLGVSPAILEFVIFCHQDESLWPMSEPAALKKRFDEIFEAQKYTKAIENIKVLKKNQTIELGKLKIIEEHAKSDKDKGERAEKRSKELYDEIEVLRVKAESLGENIKEAKAEYDAAWEQISYLGSIVGELNGKRIEQRAKQENVQKLKRNLKEMTDSDEELQSMLEQYEERVQLLQDDAEAQKQRYQDLQRELQQSRESLGAKERELGSFEAQKSNYERQLQNREDLVKQTARGHNIRGFDLDVDDEQVHLFMERISKMARDQNAAFERARRDTQQELQRAQEVLNRINQQKSTLNQRKENARSLIGTNDRKINSLQSDLNRIEIDEGGKAAFESSIEDIDTRLRNAKSEFESAKWDKQIEDLEAQSRTLDSQKEKLDEELIQGTKHVQDSARVDHLRKELKERQRSLDTMVGAHGSKISDVVGGSWQPSTVESDFQASTNRSNSYVAEAERQRDGTARELEQLNYKLNTCRADLKNKYQELKSSEATVRDAIDDEPAEFPEVLQQLENNRDILKRDQDSFSHLKKYYGDCLDTAKENNMCRMCRRTFRSSEGKLYDQFVSRLEQYLSDAAKQAMEDEAKDAEVQLKAARGASAAFDTWERLKEKEIPTLEAEERRLASRHETLTSQMEEHDATVSERQDSKREVESLSKTVQNIAKYAAEIASLDTQISELSVKSQDAGSSRGLVMVQDDLKANAEQSRTVKHALTRAIGERERSRGTINSLEIDLRDVKSKLSAAVYQLKEKESIEKQIGELKTLNGEQRESLKSIDQELQGLGPELSQAQAKYDDIARRGEEKDRQLQEESSGLNSSLHRLQMAEKEILDYIDRGGPQQLARARGGIENVKQDIVRIEGDMQRITKEVNHIQSQLRNHEDTKRSIQDNQDYRRDLRDLQAIGTQIRELESQNAEADKERYEREGNHWEMERNRLVAEQAQVMGQMASKDDQLQQLIKDWETEYQGAAQKYKEAHIRVETTKAAVEDLGRYGGALDKAIMKYHTLKMEEINRIIEELWRKTYQGTDVDTILIRSDNETLKGNKSYNYRVCMVKQDVEMDMRGRCSAGQKVLASIIIRLALAECFGVNCGLIALDEPTTNLDRDNIRALAESLAEIIRVRRQQSNFQLIVITHEEEFLRYMQCADFCDYYWRVSRNEKQTSILERQSIAEVV